MEPFSAFEDLLYGFVEFSHGAEIIGGYRYAARHTDKISVRSFHIILPRGEICKVWAYGFKNAKVVPIKYVIGYGDTPIFKLIFVLLEVLSSVYAKSVSQVCQRKYYQMKKNHLNLSLL